MKIRLTILLEIFVILLVLTINDTACSKSFYDFDEISKANDTNLSKVCAEDILLAYANEIILQNGKF